MDTFLLPQLKPYEPVQTFNDAENGHWSERIVYMAVNAAFSGQNILTNAMGTKSKVNRTISFLQLIDVLPTKEAFPTKWRFLKERQCSLKAVQPHVHQKYIFEKPLWNKAENLIHKTCSVVKKSTPEIDICAALMLLKWRLHIKEDMTTILNGANGPIFVKVMLAWYASLPEYSCRRRKFSYVVKVKQIQH